MKSFKIGREAVMNEKSTVAAVRRDCQNFATDEGVCVRLECEGNLLEVFSPANGFTAAKILIERIRPSTCSDYPGATDAHVYVRDGGNWIEGEVTLLPHEDTGRNGEGYLDAWGELSNWASGNLHNLDANTLTDIISAVREAAKQSARAA